MKRFAIPLLLAATAALSLRANSTASAQPDAAASARAGPQVAQTVAASASDEQSIRDLFAALKSRIEARDLDGFMALFSPDYYHFGANPAAIRADIGQVFPSVRSFTYAIDHIEITGGDARVYASCYAVLDSGESHAWTEPDTSDESNGFGWLAKTASGWKIVGNQERSTVHLATGHSLPATGYFYRLRTESLLPINSVSVTGPSIPTTSLSPDSEWGGFTAFVSPSSYPPLGSVYSFDIKYADGTRQVITDTVKSWIPDAPTPTVSTVNGVTTIRWNDIRDSVPAIESYWVIVSGNGASWSRTEIPANQMSIVYNDDGKAFGALVPGKTYSVIITLFNTSDDYAHRDTTFTLPAAAPSAPVIIAQPVSQSATSGSTTTFSAPAAGVPTPSIQWQRDGNPIPGATSPMLTLANITPSSAGIYSAIVTNASGSVASAGAILGVSTNAKVLGSGSEVGANIFVATNGNTFDQVLLSGAAATVTADPGQITRTSFLDLTGDIVQVEFSGAGTLSLVLANPAGPVAPSNYNQTVNYMRGHVGLVVVGANETTHLGVFSVGRITAVNQALFKNNVVYDGLADLAYIAISSANGKFGGLRAANASFFASQGMTGIYAPGVQFTGPVFLGDINASTPPPPSSSSAPRPIRASPAAISRRPTPNPSRSPESRV